MNVFVVFGSGSDAPTYEPIVNALTHPIMKVCSAHRTPDMLEHLLGTLEYGAVIAGAGLAAHLPGVVASQTLKPVFGVPVNSNFDGLDSLLAIVQMPPGVPVLGVGVDKGTEAARIVQSIGDCSRIMIVNRAGDAATKAIGACTKALDELGAQYEQGEVAEDALNIIFVPLDGTAPQDTAPAIHVAINKSTTAADAQLLLAQMERGCWVGMNRGENAAIGAVQLLNMRTGEYTRALEEQRERARHKIYAANKTESTSYAAAGVNIDEGNAAVRKIKEHVRTTFTKQVLADVGLFGGLYAFDKNAYEDPVLVASSDGVGTKVEIAARVGSYASIGEDLVNHCVNDILAQGATPLFFLDYVAAAHLDAKIVSKIVEGMSRACKENGCALIGGETAEMPGVYKQGKYDVASCIVGVVERARIIDGKNIRVGDTLIGLPSSGLHTNGYSLARKVLLEDGGMLLSDTPEGLGGSLGDALLAVHRSYLPALKPLLGSGMIKGIAHITGGGLTENIPRVVPKGLGATIRRGAWEVPPLFSLIARTGNIEEREMYRVLNMGIGLVLITDKPEELMGRLAKEKPIILGTIHEGEGIAYD